MRITMEEGALSQAGQPSLNDYLKLLKSLFLLTFLLKLFAFVTAISDVITDTWTAAGYYHGNEATSCILNETLAKNGTGQQNWGGSVWLEDGLKWMGQIGLEER